MTDQTAEPASSRRRIPPAWILMLAGLAFLGAAAIRYFGDSERPWEVRAVAGALFIVAGLVVAALKRSFR